MDAEMKVGEVARRTGVSVRTLHHYESIGLLVPSGRTASGHRLYSAADLDRLHRIRSLKAMGLGLEEIGACLDRTGFDLLAVVERQLAHLRASVERSRRLIGRLESLADTLRASGEATIDDLMETMTMMNRFEKHYTPEQLETLRRRGEEIGAERIREAEREWAELLAAVQREMDRGTDPRSEKVKALARRWRALIEEFTGGDPGIEESLRGMYRDDPHVAADRGYTPDADRSAFLGQAFEALGEDG